MTLEEFEQRKSYYDDIMRHRMLTRDEAKDYIFALQEEAKVIAIIRLSLAIFTDEQKRRNATTYQSARPYYSAGRIVNRFSRPTRRP